MKFENIEELEQQLQSAAPSLPPTLRSRTLARCATQTDTENRRRKRANQGLALAVACVCVFHWLTSSALDAQRTQIITGAPPSSQHYVQAQEKANDSTDLQRTLRNRSHLLAAWMINRDQWPAALEMELDAG